MDDFEKNFKKFKEFLQTPVGLIVAAFILVLILYYIMSPYQNCVRSYSKITSAEGKKNKKMIAHQKRICTKITGS